MKFKEEEVSLDPEYSWVSQWSVYDTCNGGFLEPRHLEDLSGNPSEEHHTCPGVR